MNLLGRVLFALKRLRYSHTFTTFAIITLIIAVPLTVLVAQKQQELRQRAAYEPSQTPSQAPSQAPSSAPSQTPSSSPPDPLMTPIDTPIPNNCYVCGDNGFWRKRSGSGTCIGLPSNAPSCNIDNPSSREGCFDRDNNIGDKTDVACASTPTAQPTPPNATPTSIACNNIANAGNQGIDTKEWELGQRQGTFLLSYDMYAIPDKLEIFYEGELVYTTGGEVSGSQNNIQVGFGPGSSTKIRVVVTANSTGTAWQYQISCPVTTTIAPTIGTTPTPIPPPTNSPTPTIGTTPTPISTPTTIPGGIQIAFNLALQGNSLTENNNPGHARRSLTVQLFNANNQQVDGDKVGQIIYDTSIGKFAGTIDLGTNIPDGAYSIKVKANKYLRKLIPGIHTLTPNATYQAPTTTLIVGDLNGDNKIDILDFNYVVSCFGNKANTPSCPNKDAADTDDNDIIDGVDLNYVIRSLAIQNGD